MKEYCTQFAAAVVLMLTILFQLSKEGRDHFCAIHHRRIYIHSHALKAPVRCAQSDRPSIKQAGVKG